MSMALVKSIWESGVLRFRNRGTLTPIITFGTLRLHEYLVVTDVDSRNAAPTAAQFLGGIITHNSKTGAGTLTVPTGALLDAAVPGLAIGETVTCYYINRGDQAVTVTAASGITVATATQTIVQYEAALLIFLKTAADTFVCYHIGA
ncbi:MAG: hypothetical protein MUP14_07765 [Dehalococcoidia bacterium]|nr:hypothetical protein [Dehalococcoidia bacterium]